MRPIFLAVLVAAGAHGQKASIEGKVVNAMTGEPLPWASVTIEGTPPVNPEARAVTGADGRFAFRDVPDGRYRIQAHHAEMTPMTRRPEIQVAAGNSVNGVELKLVPRARVSGTVRDENGRPVQGCSVSAYAASGWWARMPLRRSIASAAVNTDGRFTIEDLQPGKYSFRAKCYQAVTTPHGPIRRGDQWRIPVEQFTAAFYPQGAPNDATGIEVSAGAVVEGIEFRVAKSIGYRINGQVEGWRPFLAGAMVTVRPEPNDAIRIDDGGGTGVNADGTIVSGPLSPGTYSVTVETLQEPRMWGRATVAVGESLPNTFTIAPAPLVPVRGVVEGEPGSPEEQRLTLSWTNRAAATWMTSVSSEVKSDGSFEAALAPGRWILSVQGLAVGTFARRVKIGQQEFDPRDVTIPAGGAEVQVIARGKMAAVEATVTGSRGPVTVIALAVPLDLLSFPIAQPAVGNRARVLLRPGEYLIAAVESNNWLSLPDSITERHGTRITVREGETRQITLQSVNPDE